MDNSVYYLDESSPRAIMPQGFTLPGFQLLPHQLSGLYRAIKMESGEEVFKLSASDKHFLCKSSAGGYDMFKDCAIRTDEHYEDYDINLRTTFGCLTDQMGYGKTYLAISIILNSLLPPNRGKKVIKTDSCYEIYVNDIPHYKTNLVVMPANIITQWQQSLAHTNLTFYTFDGLSRVCDFYDYEYRDKKDAVSGYNFYVDNPGETAEDKTNKSKPHKLFIFNKDKFNKMLDSIDVILIPMSSYDVFKNTFKEDKMWARIFFDEIQSLDTIASFRESAFFTWFITATPTEIIDNYCPPLKKFMLTPANTVEERVRWLGMNSVHHTVDFLKMSYKMPPANVVYIRCGMEASMGAILDMLPTEVVGLINAGDSKGAIEKLNCNKSTENGIVFTMVKIHVDRKEELEKMLPVLDDKATIARVQREIRDLDEKIKKILQKTEDIFEKICFICAGEFKQKVVMNCCSKAFCFGCLFKSIGNFNSCCPHCRTHISDAKSSFTAIQQGAPVVAPVVNEEIRYGSVEKKIVLESALRKIIANNSNKKGINCKILIFSLMNNTFSVIENTIRNLGLTHEIIEKDDPDVHKKVERYNKGTTNVLMLNAYENAAGLNLQETTHLFFFHRFFGRDGGMEREYQVYGRGQRIGRTTPLNVIYLLYSNEDSVKFPFVSLPSIVESDSAIKW